MTQENPQNPQNPQGAVPPPGASPMTGAGPMPPLDYAAERPVAQSSDDRTMAMLCHLLAIFTGFIGPLIIWLIKKDQSRFVDDQGKESLNFQLTMLLAHLVAGALWCLLIGMFITPVLLVVNIVFCVMATIASNKGEAYRYPLAIRLIK